jgi:hypothetical protein
VSSHGSDGPVSGGACGSCPAHAVGTMYLDGEGRTLSQLAPLPADGGAGAKLGVALVTVFHGPSMPLEVPDGR